MTEPNKKKGKKKSSQYPNPLFDQESFPLLYQKWKEAVGEETLQEGKEEITQESMRKTCEAICKNFPRGTHCGSLLWDPIVDDTPLEERGVSMRWLNRALAWMRKVCEDQSPIIPTRLFVALVVEPLVLSSEEEALPLYFFLPLADRGKPSVFMSHGWDSWLRHLLFLPPTSVPGNLAKQNGPQKTFLWMDIFAIVQDPGSTKQQSEVAQVGEVVRTIGKTCIVVPGHGSIQFALLPARRSWCCLEIAFTTQNNLSARVGWNKAFFDGSFESPENLDYHRRLIQEIGQLKCSNAQTRNEYEKETILDLLEQKHGLEQADLMVRRAILEAFYKRYSSAFREGSDELASCYEQALNGL